MSGSYDRPTGRPTGPPTLQSQARIEHDPYYGTVTGEPVFTDARAPLPRSDRRAEKATTRRGRASAQPTTAPIVPAGSVTGRSLTLVITIMCFLACLTAGAVYMMNQSASAWLRDIASEVTVQIEAKERSDVDKLVAARARYGTPVGPIRVDFSYNLNPPIYPVIYDFYNNPPHVGQAGTK